jgi:glyoxylase I family protein
VQLDIEHFACNVSDPAAMAAWYVANLGMRIVRQVPTPPYIHFLADAGGRVVIEIYSNPADPVPDYTAMHPLRFHVAFKTDDPDAALVELVGAGATRSADACRWIPTGDAARSVGAAAATLQANDSPAAALITPVA